MSLKDTYRYNNIIQRCNNKIILDGQWLPEELHRLRYG